MTYLWKTLVGLALILQVTACDVQTNPTSQDYLLRAQNFFDEGELSSAEIELKNALRENAENAQARWLLGKLYLDTGNSPAAEKELMRARELGATDESVLPLLVVALIEQGKFDQVLDIDLPPDLSPAAVATVLAVQGDALLNQNSMEEAIQLYEQALTVAPESLAGLTGKARWSLAQGEYAEAQFLLDTVFELDADYAPAWSLQGSIERSENQFRKAEESYTRAIEGRRNNTGDLLQRASLRILLGEYDKAQADLDELKKQLPGHSGVNFTQGSLYFHTRRYPEARDSLEKAVNSNPRNVMAAYYLGQTYYNLGSWSQAEQKISFVVSQSPAYIPGRRLLARIRFKEEKYAEVEELVGPILAENSNDLAAMNLMAEALLEQGRVDEGVALLEKAVALQPESAEAKMRLGMSLLRLDDRTAEAQEYIESALEIQPGYQQGDIALIVKFVRQREYEKALAAAGEYQKRHPESARPHNLFGLVYLEMKQPEAAAAAFKEALKINPGDVSANTNLAVLAMQRGEITQARGFYEDILARDPEHLHTLLQVAELDARELNEAGMVEKLQRAASAHPDALNPKVQLARYYLKKGQPDKVVQVFSNLPKEHALNPLMLELLAQSQLEQGAAKDAKWTLKQLVEVQPESANAHYLLSMAYAQLGDPEGMTNELRKTLDLDTQHLQARISLTRLLINEGEMDEARENLAVLKKQAPGNPDVLFVEGIISRAIGQQQQALDSFKEVHESASSTSTMLTLSQQKWGMGDKAGSVAIQEQWVSDHPEDIAARMALAISYMALSRDRDAVEQYTSILGYSENNLVALNNLAWLLQDSDPKQALQYAEKAYNLSPESGDIVDTYAVMLLKNGMESEGLLMAERAVEKSPDNPTIQYHKAMALEANGKRDEALLLLSNLLSDAEMFPERPKAEEMLQRLK